MSSSAPAVRARRWPRAGWFAVGVVAAAPLALLGGEASGWRFLRGPLQNVATKNSGMPVRIEGDFSAGLLWRPHIVAEHFSVGAAPGFDAPFLVDAGALRIEWHWGDLWRWWRGDGLRIKRLQADTLDANLVRQLDGHANWQARAAAAQAGEAAAAPRPRIGVFHIGQGRIAVDDQVTATHLRIEIRGGEGAQHTGTRASYEALVSGRFRALPLHLKVHTGGALPLLQDDEAGVAATAVPIRVEGEAGVCSLFFDGSVAALLSAHRLDGNLRLRGPSLAALGTPVGLTLPQTPPYSIEGRLAQDAGVWRLQAKPLIVGSSQLVTDLRFDTTRTPPQLSGKLGGPRLLLADLGPAVGTDGKPPAAKRRVLPERQFDLPSLRAMSADVQVAIDELDFGSAALAPMHQLSTHMLLEGGVLRLADLKAVVAGGKVTGTSGLDASADPARWSADLKFSGLDLAGWVRGVQAPAAAASAAPATNTRALRNERLAARQGGEQPVRAYLTGEMQGALKVGGQGRSTAEIIGSLDGSAHAWLRDGTVSHLTMELAGLDIAQALGVALRGDRPLPLRCAYVEMALQGGVATLRQAVIDNSDSTVHVVGRIDLRDETLALKLNVKPKDFSPLTLRAPVLVGGTLAAPSVGIQGSRLAGRAIVAAVLGVLAGPAALLPFVDPADPDPKDPCAGAPR